MRFDNCMVRLGRISVNHEVSMPDVRCIDCGLLALRHKGYRTLVEAEQAFRNSGEPPSQHAHYPSDYEPLPICLPRVINFRETVGDNPSGFTGRLLKALHEPHPCLEFKEWEQGFTPKEHQEMKHQEWLLDFQTRRDDADRKWRQECDDRDRLWQEKQAAKAENQAETARDFQRSQADAQRRHERRTLVVSLGSLFVALCGVGIAAYAALKQKDPQAAPIAQPSSEPDHQ